MKDSRVFENSVVHEIFRNSAMVSGKAVLGNVEVYSCSHTLGQRPVTGTSLKMAARGTARDGASLVTQSGGMSPGTVDDGFFYIFQSLANHVFSQTEDFYVICVWYVCIFEGPELL